MFALIAPLIFILMIIFIFLTIWILFVFIKNFKTNRLIYRSIFKTLFKSTSSIIIIILFYAISFALIGGGATYVFRIEKAANTQIIENKSHQGDAVNGYINEYILDGQYVSGYNQRMFNFLIQNYDVGSDYIISGPLGSEENFIIELDKFVAQESQLSWLGSNAWEDYGLSYFDDFNSFVNAIVYKTVFDNFNNGLYSSFFSEKTDYEIVYNIYVNNVYKPIKAKSENELYYFMGFNSPNNFLRYSKNGEYVIDDYEINKIEDGLTKDDIENELSKSTNYGNGTAEDPYKIVLQSEYAEANNYNPGDILEIDANEYEILATANFANVIYPYFDFQNLITDFDNQAAILMNSNTVREVSNGDINYTVDYGYTDLYDEVDDFSYYLPNDDSNEASVILTRTREMEDLIQIESGGSFAIGQTGLITQERVSPESSRIYTVINELTLDNSFLSIMSMVFLIIVVIVLSLLIQKRVKDYSKQFGTLKALGLSKRQSSVAFVVYPMFIIGVGGMIAFFLSIPVQMFFVNLVTSFYSLPVGGYALSFSLFWYLFIFSAIVLFSIAYLISIWILRKQTIDLLSNRANDAPNLLTRSTGKLIPNKMSFETSYEVKGLTRASGKSAILLFSIFLATTLTSLSFAASTMVNKLIDLTSGTFDFEYYNTVNFNNYDYDVYDLETESYENLTPLYNDSLMSSSEILVYQAGLNNSNWQQHYDDLGEEIIAPFDNVVVSSDGSVNYYLPKEAILNYLIQISLIESAAGENYDPTIQWSNGYSVSSLRSFLTYFELDTFSKLFYIDLNIEDLNNLGFLELYNLLNSNYDYYFSDVTFRDFYYDSSFQAILAGERLGIPKNNDRPILDETKYTLFNLTSYQEASDILDIFAIDEEAVEALEDEEENLNPGEQLDYLPVIMDSFTYNFILENYPVEIDPITGYWRLTFLDSNYILDDVPINILYVYDSYISIGFLTTETLIESYDDLESLNYEVKYSDVFWSEYIPNQNYTLGVNNDLSGDLTFQYFIDNPKNLEGPVFSKDVISSQTEVIYNIFKVWLLIISVFALIIGLVLIIIAMKEINDKSKREVSLLKSFGYSSTKATVLVISPFIFILVVGFALAIPFALLILSLLASVLTSATGSNFVFTLTSLQWLMVFLIMFVLVVFLLIYSFWSFRKTNALDAIRETDE